jgi:hypothetical protein
VISTNAVIYTNSYTCEADSHDPNLTRVATEDNPVIRLVKDGRGVWRCAKCILDALEPRECSNCGASISDTDHSYCQSCIECSECSNIAKVCEDHATEQATCSNCGRTLERAFCDAACALEYGYDGGHECTSSCANCGDEAHYCSTGCALADGSSLYCDDCGTDIPTPEFFCKTCGPQHEAKVTPAGQPLSVQAASDVAVADDGTVTIDGLTIRF